MICYKSLTLNKAKIDNHTDQGWIIKGVRFVSISSILSIHVTNDESISDDMN